MGSERWALMAVTKHVLKYQLKDSNLPLGYCSPDHVLNLPSSAGLTEVAEALAIDGDHSTCSAGCHVRGGTTGPDFGTVASSGGVWGEAEKM
jgi:hypothetical protein